MSTRFLIINCEDSLKWTPIDFGMMFETLLCDKLKNESWNSVNLARGDLLPEDIMNYTGVVITGSHYNVRDMKSWYQNLIDFIKYSAEVGYPKIYGGCFGCQIIGHALGGKVSKNPGEIFILKVENILFLPGFSSLFSSGGDKESLRLIESHGDCVEVLPEQANLVASSKSCKHEMFICGSKDNIFACQSHPEFELQYASKIIKHFA